MNELEFILEVLRVCAEHDSCESILWRTDGRYGPVSFFINCNDFFGPCADGEAVTRENLPLFRKTFEDCAALDKANPDTHEFAVTRADLLFAARVRGVMPWKRKYDKLPEFMKPLFDEAARRGEAKGGV